MGRRLGFSVESEPIGFYVYMELAHAIMNTDKPQGIQSTNWRTWRANGVIPVQRPASLWQEKPLFQFEFKCREKHPSGTARR